LRRGKDTPTRLPFSIGVAFEKTARAKMRKVARRLMDSAARGHIDTVTALQQPLLAST